MDLWFNSKRTILEKEIMEAKMQNALDIHAQFEAGLSFSLDIESIHQLIDDASSF
jgi:hypothetical protein